MVDVRSSIRKLDRSYTWGRLYLNALRWPNKAVSVKLMHAEALVKLLGEMGIEPSTIVDVYAKVTSTDPKNLLKTKCMESRLRLPSKGGKRFSFHSIPLPGHLCVQFKRSPLKRIFRNLRT